MCISQVETIGDAYMVVGGVPMKSDRHAVEVAEMAFAMLNCMKSLKDPSDKTGRRHLELRIGGFGLSDFMYWVVLQALISSVL